MVDLAALEAEVLGEDLVEPVTGLEDTPEPETEKGGHGQIFTTKI